MATDIFISRPTYIDLKFEDGYNSFHRYLSRRGLRTLRLGAGQYTLDAPLLGVIDLIRKCKGAIILGYPQYEFFSSITKAGVPDSQFMMSIPTPWNHIEAALAFRENIPVLIIAHEGITTGVFDFGVTGKYIITTNLSKNNWHNTQSFLGVFRKWEMQLNTRVNNDALREL